MGADPSSGGHTDCYTRLFMAVLRACLVAMILCGASVAQAALDCDDVTLEENHREGAWLEPVLTSVIIPCAMVESGQLGPDCKDANFYVVNQVGTALCQVELSLFAAAHSLPVVERAPWAHGGSPLFASMLGLPVSSDVPPFFQPGVPVARPLDKSGLLPADAHHQRPARPS